MNSSAHIPLSLDALSLPYTLESHGEIFEISGVTGGVIRGAYSGKGPFNRVEVLIEQADGKAEFFSLLAADPYTGPTPALAGTNTGFTLNTGDFPHLLSFHFKKNPALNTAITASGIAVPERRARESIILFDVSDLVYYLGHHDNLTGIQRVQACVILGLCQKHPDAKRLYISYNNRDNNFSVIDGQYFESLILDLSRQNAAREVLFDRIEARLGILPESTPLVSIAEAEDHDVIVYLLGAAWVNRDYFHRILQMKRDFSAKFYITIHDLIPIFARETCDQGTALVFEEFLRKSYEFVDHYFAVSEYTAYDFIRYSKSLGKERVPVSVIENAHSFDEFLVPSKATAARGKAASRFGKDGYVLLVSTIEGRKNHSYVFDVWQRLIESGEVSKVPTLVCIGRYGWRAEDFVEKMLLSHNLNNKICVLSDISDAELDELYANCLFTVYPSTYEGWGLPVGESLAKGKICVSSKTSSIPEVSGEFGIFFDIHSVEDGFNVLKEIINDKRYRAEREKALKTAFRPRVWSDAASELFQYVTILPKNKAEPYPILALSQEYKIAALPVKNGGALGLDMVNRLRKARCAPLTGRANSDADLLTAQSSRAGGNWCEPEGWGTWSLFPSAERLFYVRPSAGASDLLIYERLRVVGLLCGSTLQVTVNGGAVYEIEINSEEFVIQLTVPLPPKRKGLVQVCIEYNVVPARDLLPELLAIDGRGLGVGVESSFILEDTNIHCRLALLEKLCFGPGASTGTSFKPASDVARIQRVVTGTDAAEAATPVWFPDQIVQIGEKVYFGRQYRNKPKLSISKFFRSGWHDIEESGVWSREKNAILGFRVGGERPASFLVTLMVKVFTSQSADDTLTIYLNDMNVWSGVCGSHGVQKVSFVVDEISAPYDNACVLRFCVPEINSPKSLGYGDDSRLLGVWLEEASVQMLPSLERGPVYSLANDGEAGQILCDGWYGNEANGTWSVAQGGRIIANLGSFPGRASSLVKICIKCRVKAPSDGSMVTVNILSSGNFLAKWEFHDEAFTEQVVLYSVEPEDDMALIDLSMVRLDHETEDAAPAGTDIRPLGIFVQSIQIMDVDLVSDNQHLSPMTSHEDALSG